MLYPRLLESRYAQTLMSIVNDAFLTWAHGDLKAKLQGVVAEAGLVHQDSIRRDASWIDALKALMGSLDMTYPPMTRKIQIAASMAAQDVNAWQSRQWGKITKTAFGIDVLRHEPWKSGVADGFVERNVGLITKLADETRGAIYDQILGDITAGKRWDAIYDGLMSSGLDGLPKGPLAKVEVRARLIARDQVGKLNGQLAERRQRDIGVSRYVWRTAQDERVRPAHADREGQVFSWDDPPEGGHPGFDYSCRCVSEPMLADVLGEIEGVEDLGTEELATDATQ